MMNPESIDGIPIMSARAIAQSPLVVGEYSFFGAAGLAAFGVAADYFLEPLITLVS
ncbi:hypothetical protein [Rhodococcus sp. ACT016]|uniref:hypothetical protein n=1 Tax=Rhodococcus sp. ACT016 TaxID=3134808 RepID=UPI003D2D8B35